MGSAVVSGAGTRVVVLTGSRERPSGLVADFIAQQRAPHQFRQGDHSRFTWLMFSLIAVMVPLVLVINGLSKGTGPRPCCSPSQWQLALRPKCCR